jgi:large subunit ribosomal protein L4
MKLDVIGLDSKKSGSIDLDDAVFAVDVRPDILQRVVTWQLAKRRAGTAKTKERAEVNGSGTKPHRQKGTGRARAGDKKAPHMRGGGVAFGPRVRDHGYKLPKKVRQLGMKCALSAKAADGKLIILEEAKTGSPKTRDLAATLAKLGWGRALVIDGPAIDETFKRAAANLAELDVLPSQGANVYDILRSQTLVLTRSAVETLQERLR